MIVGVGPWAGHNYHFWPNVDRADVDTNDIVGLFTTCEARLIVSDPTKPDDRSMCKNLLDMAGDWWIDKTANWKPDWTANFGIGNGRCKWVLPYWQSFNFCTLTPAQIIANPPLSITTKVLENTASKNKFTTYPNPFVNQIYFDYEINGSVEVFTVDGKLMYQESGKLNSIDLEKLSDGVYFLKVNNNGGNNFYKIIKSNQNY